MSLMTQSLLLHAQSLRLDGQPDESIDLLRTVISQCDAEEARRRDGCPPDDASRRMRLMASYQLALLLLQRSGRQLGSAICNGNSATASGGVSDGSEGDAMEADAIMWKLGYRLRLSSQAFGYPPCKCGHRSDSKPSKSSELPLHTIDNVLPPTVFDALRNAFRPESRYWSEFYTKVDTDAATSQFASHNIPLPTPSGNPTNFLDSLQSAKSLLEQVAIIAQHRLQERFPELANATSVEVWSHRRPPDGQHQLHYDMDEILLWQRRKERSQVFANKREGLKRQKIETRNGANEGISCPSVSCVLTINVPKRMEACHRCGSSGNSAPTIVCNQSIARRNESSPNMGWLCYPKPNRLLAFDGSLLHGVVPGMPFATDTDGEEGRSDNESEHKGSLQRITLMMGFWKEVCLTVPDKDSVGTASEIMGPNVPFDSVAHNSWANEFSPISISEGDIAHNGQIKIERESITVVDPLWVPLRSTATSGDQSAHEIGPRKANAFYGRFFLKSLQPTDIDSEVLSGK